MTPLAGGPWRLQGRERTCACPRRLRAIRISFIGPNPSLGTDRRNWIGDLEGRIGTDERNPHNRQEQVPLT